MSGDSQRTVYFADIEAARNRLSDTDVVRKTPVEPSNSLEAMTGADQLILKMEHLQRTGSFKTRGAYNKISKRVNETDLEHVVAASAGNHAQGVAIAATKLGIDSTIVMPRTASQAKVEATEGYGATVELVGRDFQAAIDHAQEVVTETDAEFVHAFDDPDIIAGQGTLGVEMYEDAPDVDTVVVPIGGGGLISGISMAFAELSPETRVVGVQAEGAETVAKSLEKGAPVTLDSVDTIADGIATGSVSELTLSIIEEHVDDVVTVTNSQIADAILLLMERAKQIVEGSGAASVAAVLGGDLDVDGESVMPLLCGGNLDMTMLRTILVHAMTRRKQILRLRVRIDDQPGKMEELSGIIGDKGANIHSVRHERSIEDLDVGEAYLVYEVETSGTEQSNDIVDAISEAGYSVDIVNRTPDGVP